MPHLIARTGRILVIDAQPAHARQLVALLGRHEHTIALAASAEEALGIVSLQPPDLVLLDTMLPQTDGFELLTALRRQPGMKSVPAILLVDKQDHDRRLDAFDAGAVDFVAKPYLADELLARVHVHLRLKLTRDRLERVAQERQQLVNLVAHDLKNPLASVLFACEMLGLPDCRPERTRRYLQIIDESTREALGYIRSYLETQTGPAQAGAAAEVPCVHLGDTLHWLAERYELQLEANGLRLRVDAPQPDVCVAIGEQVLRQVGENLISNALKYARGGGELELVARPGAHRLLAAAGAGSRPRHPGELPAAPVHAVPAPARARRDGGGVQRTGTGAGPAERGRCRRPAVVRGSRRRRRALPGGTAGSPLRGTLRLTPCAPRRGFAPIARALIIPAEAGIHGRWSIETEALAPMLVVASRLREAARNDALQAPEPKTR